MALMAMTQPSFAKVRQSRLDRCRSIPARALGTPNRDSCGKTVLMREQFRFADAYQYGRVPGAM